MPRRESESTARLEGAESILADSDAYTFLPGACPACGTTEGGAYAIVLTGPQEDGVQLTVFTVFCKTCFSATEAEDFEPTQKALARVLELIDEGHPKGLEA